MKQKIKQVCCLTVIGLLVFLLGCGDDSGDGNKESGHDFGDNNKNLYLAMGDSITKGSQCPCTPYPYRLGAILQKNVQNSGIAGELSSGGASRISSALMKHKPGYILLLYGANDIIYSKSRASIIDNLRFMIQSAKANKTIPIIATLTPMIGNHALYAGSVNELNDMIRDLARSESVRVVDLEKEFGDETGLLLEDGLHPNDSGTEVIAVAFYDKLK